MILTNFAQWNKKRINIPECWINHIVYRQSDYWHETFGASNHEICSRYIIKMFYQNTVFCPP